ncbi:leucine-rich repeat and immunoglobulin-like domain-containing nogo receptor-interacting protein 4b [Lepisosteus oculatus]|uniref:leucine-rich repeat and immunoglobulin-like domain-containing nogo receptor-interacting protein 4b n=1 Tax=Lepisosteus oculatus TaxID=7918 RepID=UPI003720793A
MVCYWVKERGHRRTGIWTYPNRNSAGNENLQSNGVSAGDNMFLGAGLRWTVWLLSLLAGLGTRASDTPWACPAKCDCHPDLREVNCSSRRLTAVPPGFSADAQRLDLAGNRLKTLGKGQFAGLPQLRELELSENSISLIEMEAFQGLRSLQTLQLRNNRLKILLVGVFSGLPSLHLLDISENEILVFLDYTFRELASLRRLVAGENDLVFISHRAFSGLQSLQELHLDRCNLTAVPTEALSQLQSLSLLRLRRLNISVLPSHSFRRLSRLRTLEVAHCPLLEAVDNNSLFGLNLTSLTIADCNLTSVPYAAIRHLVYLRFLDLSYNPISVVRANLLGDLLRLQEFHLAGGSLIRIEPGAFRGLSSFRLLNVSSNRLPTLEEGVFHSVGFLKTLRLDGNPLACDCRLLWLVRRRRLLGFDGRQPSCAAPERVQGRQFRDFSETGLPGLFTCRQARILDRKPQEVRVEEGTTVLFFCKADGDPPPAVAWLTPRQTRLSPAGRIRVLANGTLEVRYAQAQDSGTYLCVASNAAGSDNLSVSLQVRGFAAGARNRSAPFFPGGWTVQPETPASPNASSQDPRPFPFDAKTLVIATTMGFLSFLSSVVICFVFMFFWSRGKGQIKHTATIDFVPRNSVGGGGGGDGADGGRFTMKLI